MQASVYLDQWFFYIKYLGAVTQRNTWELIWTSNYDGKNIKKEKEGA
jgi:hypothetical protein